jgi:glycosyltransferase involved in cell wall biosynthesis
MIKVLYISYDGMTDPLGQSQVIPYLSGLSKLGYEIHLISFEKSERFDRKDFIAQLLKSEKINWHPLTYTKSPPVLSTLKDLWALRNLAIKLHKKHNFAIVHCRSYLSALVGEYLKKRFGIKFIFDMRGFWADERVEGKIWNLKNPLFKAIYHFFKKKEIEFLKKADYTISLTYKAKSIIESWPNSSLFAPIEVIPCCVDIELFDYANLKKNDIQFQKNDEEFVLCYLGAIGTWYMLDEMLLFFSKLIYKRPESRFLFITQEAPELIINAGRKYGIPKEKISIFRAERSQVPAYLSQADVAIFFILPSFSKMASSPTKQGEMMAMGLPIICNSGVGDTDYVMEKYECGFLVKDISNFDAAVDLSFNIKDIPKEKIRAAAAEFYGLSNGISRCKCVYEKVLEN